MGQTSQRLAFIRCGRGLGISLGEVRALLVRAGGEAYDRGSVREIALHHPRDIKAKVRGLARLERTLAAISSECEAGVAPRCPVVEVPYGGRA